MKRWFRWLGIVALVPVALAGMVGAALAYPQPFFAYHAERGRLAIYSDRPFDPAKAQVPLAQVDARVKASPLDDGAPDAIYVANAPWRQLLFMNLAYGAGGVNFYPWTRNVFLRSADIDRNRLIGRSGKPTEPPRTFVYFAAHEIGHSLTGKRLGAAQLWNWRLPQWVREGYADYVGLGGDVDVDALYARYRKHDPKMDWAKSGQYTTFRMLAAYFLKREHWSVDRLLNCGLTQNEALRRMDAGMKS
jgi:hypothetical protein